MSAEHSKRLLLLLQASLTRRDARTLPPMDVPAVLDQAAAQQVHLFLYPYLKTGNGLFDPHVLAQLRGMVMKQARDAERYRAQAAELLGALAAAPIPAMPLKGLWLAEQAYPEPACRTMHDLDVLVPAADESRAWNVLESLGYRAPRPADGKHRLFVHPDWLLPVELHTQLDHGPEAAARMPSFWDRSEPAVIAGAPCRALTLDDQVLALSAHTLRHRFGYYPLRALLDLALVLRRYGPGLDMVRLLSRARDLRLVKGASLMVEMAGTLAGFEKEVALPEPFKPEPHRVAEAWRLVLDEGMFRAQPPDAMARLAREKRWWKRLEIVGERIFLPPDEMLAAYPWSARPGLRLFAVAARFRDLLPLYGGALWRLAKGDPRALEALDVDSRRRALVEALADRSDGSDQSD